VSKLNKKLRRSLLYIPGNNPSMMQTSYIYGSDCIVLDLEDSVSLKEKDAARDLVFHALTAVDFEGAELFVRVNNPYSEIGKRDIKMVVKTGKASVRLPKAECKEDIHICDELISDFEREFGIENGETKMMAAIETAKGVVNVNEIAVASKRLVGISLGAEDFATDLGTKRSNEGTELFFARSAIVVAAKSAGIDPIDTVYSDISDEDGFKKEVELIKQLGFVGKSVINPKQIKSLHQIFNPTEKEIHHALNVMEAIKEAEQKGSGVIALNGKMIDKPIVDRAKHMIELAKASGLLEGDAYE